MVSPGREQILSVGGKPLLPKGVGKLTCIKCNQFGEELGTVTIDQVSYLPGSSFNLFCVSRMTSKLGWEVSKMDKEKLILSKIQDGVACMLTFDVIIQTSKGAVYCGYFKCPETKVANTTMPENTKPICMNIRQAHAKLGHANEAMTRKMARALGIKITRGSMPPCIACTLAKAKRKNGPKLLHCKTEDQPGRVLHLDIAHIKTKINGKKVPKQNLFVLVDATSKFIYYNSYVLKDHIVKPTCELFHKWITVNKISIEVIRCDNARENKSLQK